MFVGPPTKVCRTSYKSTFTYDPFVGGPTFIFVGGPTNICRRSYKQHEVLQITVESWRRRVRDHRWPPSIRMSALLRLPERIPPVGRRCSDDARSSAGSRPCCPRSSASSPEPAKPAHSLPFPSARTDATRSLTRGKRPGSLGSPSSAASPPRGSITSGGRKLPPPYRRRDGPAARRHLDVDDRPVGGHALDDRGGGERDQ